MSARKNQQTWGGKRKGAGRRAGKRERMKICISVDKQNWQAALNRSKNKGSWLVDKLISDHLNNGRSNAELEAS